MPLKRKGLKITKLKKEPQANVDWDFLERELQKRLDAAKRLEEEEEKAKQQAADMATIRELVGELKNLRGMVEGLMEMSKHAADQLDQFKKVAMILEQSLRSPSETDDYTEYAEETPEAAQRIRNNRIRRMMQAGLTESEARQRLGERDIYTTMIRQRES